MTVGIYDATAQKIFHVDLLAQPQLLEPALLTVLIEVPLFWLCGWRKFFDCAYFAGVNVVTNLLLNEFIAATDGALWWEIILPSEIFVVLSEFVLCGYRFDMTKKLFVVLVFTNAASFFAGLALEFWEVV